MMHFEKLNRDVMQHVLLHLEAPDHAALSATSSVLKKMTKDLLVQGKNKLQTRQTMILSRFFGFDEYEDQGFLTERKIFARCACARVSWSARAPRRAITSLIRM